MAFHIAHARTHIPARAPPSPARRSPPPCTPTWAAACGTRPPPPLLPLLLLLLLRRRRRRGRGRKCRGQPGVCVCVCVVWGEVGVFRIASCVWFVWGVSGVWVWAWRLGCVCFCFWGGGGICSGDTFLSQHTPSHGFPTQHHPNTHQNTHKTSQSITPATAAVISQPLGAYLDEGKSTPANQPPTPPADTTRNSRSQQTPKHTHNTGQSIEHAVSPLVCTWMKAKRVHRRRSSGTSSGGVSIMLPTALKNSPRR